jgi:hypothetical protein
MLHVYKNTDQKRIARNVLLRAMAAAEDRVYFAEKLHTIIEHI